MLVLSRKKQEQIVIDGPCVLTICDLDNTRVKLGFDADRDTRIDRKEVRDRIDAEKAASHAG